MSQPLKDEKSAVFWVFSSLRGSETEQRFELSDESMRGKSGWEMTIVLYLTTHNSCNLSQHPPLKYHSRKT